MSAASTFFALEANKLQKDHVVTVKVRVPAQTPAGAVQQAEAMAKAGGCKACRVTGVEEVPSHPGSFLLNESRNGQEHEGYIR